MLDLKGPTRRVKGKNIFHYIYQGQPRDRGEVWCIVDCSRGSGGDTRAELRTPGQPQQQHQQPTTDSCRHQQQHCSSCHHSCHSCLQYPVQHHTDHKVAPASQPSLVYHLVCLVHSEFLCNVDHDDMTKQWLLLEWRRNIRSQSLPEEEQEFLSIGLLESGEEEQEWWEHSQWWGEQQSIDRVQVRQHHEAEHCQTNSVHHLQAEDCDWPFKQNAVLWLVNVTLEQRRSSECLANWWTWTSISSLTWWILQSWIILNMMCKALKIFTCGREKAKARTQIQATLSNTLQQMRLELWLDD